MAQQTWLITGVSSGFGRGMAEKLLERGDRVAGMARKPEVLHALTAKYGDRLWLTSLDLTQTGAIRPAVDAAFAHFGRIDVVVNNAGYGLFGAAEELTDEQIRHQIDTNLTGSIQVIRAALPHLRAQGGGRILQVSSTGGQYAFPGFSLYHATKWGIEGFVEALTKEVAPFGIECTILEPGATMTNFAQGLVSPPAMDVYEATPVGDVRRALEANAFPMPSRADKMVQAFLHAADMNPAPKRLGLGSDTYTLLREAWTERLAVLEAYKELALSTSKNA